MCRSSFMDADSTQKIRMLGVLVANSQWLWTGRSPGFAMTASASKLNQQITSSIQLIQMWIYLQSTTSIHVRRLSKETDQAMLFYGRPRIQFLTTNSAFFFRDNFFGTSTITTRDDGATFGHGVMILPPKYLEYSAFSSVFGLCNFSGKDKPCTYIFAWTQTDSNSHAVCQKRSLIILSMSSTIRKLELSTARLISVK